VILSVRKAAGQARPTTNAGLPDAPLGVASASSWLVMSQGVTLVSGIVASVVLARTLGPEGQGMYSLGVLVVTLATLLVGQGILAANIHFTGSGRFLARDLGHNSGLVVVAGTAACWLLLAALAVTGALRAVLPGVSESVTLVAALAIPIFLVRQLAAGILTGQQRISRTAVIDIAQSIVLVVAVCVATLLLKGDAALAMAAYVVAGLAGAALAVGYLRSHGVTLAPRWRPDVARSAMGYGVRSNLGVALQFLTYRLDFLLVNAIAGTAIVGQYAIASRVTELLWIIPAAAGTVIFALRSRGGTTDGTRQTIRTFWTAMLLTVGAAAGLSLLGPIAIPLLYSDAFAGAVPALLIMVPGAALLGCSAVLANDLAGRNRPGLVTLAAVVGFVVTVALDLALIPRFGMTGAAVASSVAYASYALAVTVAFLRVTGTPVGTFAAGAAVWRRATPEPAS
jgi:O-antigen/teichoic acid export membrane protein